MSTLIEELLVQKRQKRLADGYLTMQKWSVERTRVGGEDQKRLSSAGVGQANVGRRRLWLRRGWSADLPRTGRAAVFDSVGEHRRRD